MTEGGLPRHLRLFDGWNIPMGMKTREHNVSPEHVETFCFTFRCMSNVFLQNFGRCKTCYEVFGSFMGSMNTESEMY